MTRDEKNRLIAEALGWKPNESRSRWHSPACQRYEENCGGKVPDFYSSEEANALVLEAMPAPELYKHAKDGVAPFAAWRCRADWGLDMNMVNLDRKAVICEAFIAWKQAK